MKTILITGDAGFYGFILKDSIIKEGHFVVSIDIEKDECKHKNYVAIKSV